VKLSLSSPEGHFKEPASKKEELGPATKAREKKEEAATSKTKDAVTCSAGETICAAKRYWRCWAASRQRTRREKCKVIEGGEKGRGKKGGRDELFSS